MKLLCIIPARKNSKRLKNKNILKLNGKLLIEWSIILATKINFFKKVIISTDDSKILNLKKKYLNVSFIQRPKKYCKQNTSMSEVIKFNLNILRKKNEYFDAVAILQPTSPLRKLKTINSAIKKFIKFKPDYLASVTKAKHTQHPKMLITKKNKNFTQNLDIKLIKNNEFYYLDGGVIFIFKIKKRYNFKKRGAFINVNFPENIDINTKIDFIKAEKFFNKNELYKN